MCCIFRFRYNDESFISAGIKCNEKGNPVIRIPDIGLFTNTKFSNNSSVTVDVYFL